MSIGLYIVLAPLYLKSVRKLQEKRFVFVKILAIIIPENGAKVSKIKCFQFAQQTLFIEIVESRLLLEKIEDYQLLQALITLSEEQKKVILLRIFYEKTFREIDWILGFPEKKAENTYYNAIKKLRKLMGGKRHGV